MNSGVRRIATFVVWVAGLGDKGEYPTRFSGPAKDALIAGDVRALIASARRSRELPANLHVAGVDVFKGHAKVYFISDDRGDEAKTAAVVGRAKNLVGSEVFQCLPAQ